MKDDHIDLVLKQWRNERPDIDPSPMAVMGRLVRSSDILREKLQRVFTESGLNGGEFDVLATLLRSGKPYTLTPNRLLHALMLSSGAMTNRVDKLESKKLVKRQADRNDRRGVLVSLTPKGLELINEVVEKHINNEKELLSSLSASEQKTLAMLLKKLLSQHEPSRN